ncbi:MAG: tetratricopeptide repeat protein, partial [Bdellovibrionales bacterium]|nr:tetratricopeptide repeat protein [Bdellovibrionales bacterium]
GSRLSNENEQDQKLSQNVDALMEQMRNFDDRLARLESKSSASAAPVVTPTPTKVKSTEATPSLFAQADSLFEAKDWKKAIVAYEKYRETYPKGRFWGEATYKIGVCFQELGLKPDAKTFFQLVVNREPTSTAARKAKYRLSQIK